MSELREFFLSNATRDIRFRLNALKRLKAEIILREKDIYRALHADLGKHEFEAYATEVGIVLHEISFALRHLRGWAKPKRVKTPLMHIKAKSYIMSEPFGVALIMSPWNYPFQLTLAPLVAAVAAGNCAVVKPSDYSRATSAVLADIIKKVFDSRHVKVQAGGREVNKSLLGERFDYIFFTGSVSVGRVVMEAAAKNLTPVTLELGGKSPCIVDETANIELAAKRIVWGKFLNAGQTCVAPDYIYVHSSVKDKLLAGLRKYIVKFYGEDGHENPQFPKIINAKHFERIKGLMQCGKTVFGGKLNSLENKISPTILTDVSWDDSVMKEEIFGPILPILTYENLDDIVLKIKSEPKPLALYLFTNNSKTRHRVLGGVSFGGGCVNDTVGHLATSYMPFGGVGDSGMGGYHGKSGFDTFSHKKSILHKSNLFDVPLRYAPYKLGVRILKWFLG